MQSILMLKQLPLCSEGLPTLVNADGAGGRSGPKQTHHYSGGEQGTLTTEGGN
jgi:hypothetical protein